MLKKFLTSKIFLFNLALAIALIFGLAYLVASNLSSFTHHGESITVPDLRGLTEDRLAKFTTDKQLNYKIVDSLYMAGKAPGTVIEQDPAPDSKVKEGRTIYLTVNSSNPPKVKMPALVDVSYRQAEAILQSFGLKPGKIIYRADLATNAVLDQLYKGKKIAPGTELYKGSSIDLILGTGMGSTQMRVPSLMWLALDEAKFVLKASSLHLGTITFDAGVKDKSKAKVYKQSPEPGGNTSIKQGEAVDIFLR